MRIELIRLLASFIAGCVVMILHEFPKALLYNRLNPNQDPKKKRNIFKIYQYIDPIGMLFCFTNQIGFSKPYMYRLKNRKSNLMLGICGFSSLFLVFAASMIYLYLSGDFTAQLTINSNDSIPTLLYQMSVIYTALISFSMLLINLFPVSTFDMGLCIAAKSPSRYFTIIKNDYFIKVLLIFTIIFGFLYDVSISIILFILQIADNLSKGLLLIFQCIRFVLLFNSYLILPREVYMDISFKLEVFEGPLDLLLHLIEKNKVNIHDIPIALITEQYLDYVNHMETKDLNVMSEFLVMAATLLNIKSKMLLPKDEKLGKEEEDPRQELVERLLEYKMYKYISLELKDRELDAGRAFYKNPSIPEEIKSYEEKVDVSLLLSDLTLAKLHRIFETVIKRQVDKIDPIRSKFGRIEKEEGNLSDKMDEIQKYARLHKTFSFYQLLMGQRDKIEIIVTFLGILELMKTGEIHIQQDNLFDDIMITYKEVVV